jgi:hypothetical protein
MVGDRFGKFCCFTWRANKAARALPHFPLGSIGTRSANASYQFPRTSGKPNRTEQLLVKMIVSVTQFGGAGLWRMIRITAVSFIKFL